MRHKSPELSAHSQKVLALLKKAAKPMSAYELLDKMRKFGVKAPPTVYRALDALLERGLIHRIETLNAFVICHEDDHAAHGAKFAVCRACGIATEIHDSKLTDIIKTVASHLKFHLEREMLELMGLCSNCSAGKA